MSWLTLASAVLLSASSASVVVQPGETLEQIAERTLGDRGGAAELKSLNGLAGDGVQPGTILRLPGPERARALSALVAARNAVSQANPSTEGQSEATESLRKAEQLFQAARYDESAAAADATWRLLSESSQRNTRFAVQVADGETKVISKSGQPIRVEREGVSRPVHPGQTLTLPNPPPHAAALLSPALVSPSDQSRVWLKPTEKGLGPMTLTWQPSPGAVGYSVEIVPLEGSPGKPVAVSVEKPEARVPLAPGKYAWTVRAVAHENEQSDPSQRRTFELSVEPLKLEVKETRWK